MQLTLYDKQTVVCRLNVLRCSDVHDSSRAPLTALYNLYIPTMRTVTSWSCGLIVFKTKPLQAARPHTACYRTWCYVNTNFTELSASSDTNICCDQVNKFPASYGTWKSITVFTKSAVGPCPEPDILPSVSRNSSVSIVTSRTSGEFWLHSRQENPVYFSHRVYKPALGPTTPTMLFPKDVTYSMREAKNSPHLVELNLHSPTRLHSVHKDKVLTPSILLPY